MSPIDKDISTYLANLTTEPGVYRMLDQDGIVLYVGKAANLKKRVNSYFTKTNMGVKTQSLISQVKAIEVNVTRSETEALLLESSLIKTLRPKYNILMRDDKTYPYLHVTSHHLYPRMEIMRTKRKPKKGDFFGPYPSVLAVRETLSTIQKVFKIRNCSDSYFSGRSRPCLQYQIKRCSAPCTGYIAKKEYRQNVEDAVKFLQGRSQDILHELETRMQDAVSQLNFEKAAQIRDQIKHLRLVQEQQGMVQLRGDADVIVIFVRPGFACVQCVTIRDGQVLASQSFFPSVPKQSFQQGETASSELWEEVFFAFVNHFYMDTPARIPATIITNHTLSDKSAFETMLTALRGKSCHIQTKPRGVKARWLDFANNNLQMAIADQMSSETVMEKRYHELQHFLNREKTIQRMECFDISHTQGEATVASCVVFDKQGPNKNEYRRFNIQGITPGDDYAAMKQVLTRRFKRALIDKNLPDVLIIDGGKGQVAIAGQVLNELNISSVQLLGVAKGPTRKAGWEQLILADAFQEVTLPPDSPALHLLQHIRDEAHRFAITFHRKKRNKAGLESSLETIPGVGPKRRQALLRRFGGVRDLAKAPVDEIAKVQGISQFLAEQIYQHFHP
ncbi:excinuclease ABC subunit UvrC [Legionella impletisoli]|uniref:UvrABC system protein C n=1 Tax=Legionella impletisoli TaxID=343510 RepID=A0A917JTB1_9GAMM|nr:excinuclease ABC subunit UvrC [Legionella impletisoli]GGI86007.1 UvrABC system protein C [Legionella impletisoli]